MSRLAIGTTVVWTPRVARWALGACLLTGAAGIGAIATTSTTAGAVGRATHLPEFPATSTLSGRFGGVTVLPHSDQAIAVGSWFGTTTSGDLIEGWNGSSWKVMTPPNLGKSVTSPGLTGVWAASVSDAWAIGYADESSGEAVQLIHWNGKSWSPKTVTGLPANSSLGGISGSSSSNIWCVGSAFDDTTEVSTPIELHFNGKAWKVLTHGPSNSSLSSVSAASATNVWAIGNRGTRYVPMVLHYNGASWAQVSSPAPKSVYLNGISATGSTAWIVGVVAGKTTSPYVMQWKGKAWATVKVPLPSGRNPELNSVVALSSSAAWAGGIVSNSSSTNFGVFMEEFANGKWSVAKVPAGGNGSSVIAFAATSHRNIWAVGGAFTGKVCASSDRPLSYHHTSRWKIVPAAAPTEAAPDC
jgi:hypothetical protein